MWPIVGHLTSAHHTVLAPTLPGHGSTPNDLIGIEWSQWLDAARDWPADVVVGQSMGAMLALSLAAEGRCRAVVAINPLAPDPDAVDGLDWRIARGAEWHDIGPSNVGEQAYERLPMASLLAMQSGVLGVDLGRITVPVLIVTSALDEVVDPASSDMVASALNGPVERLRLDGSGHVATLDVERDDLGRAIVAFVARLG